MTVIPFRSARPHRPVGRPVEPPAALAGMRMAACLQQPEAAADRLRMQQNLAALCVVIVLVGLGSWLIESLQKASRIQACIEAGHRSCVPLAIPPR
jgi:hypothetical protein